MEKEIRQAIILAAGKGTRLKPYTDIIPKVMIPINGKPLISWIIEHLKIHGIKEVIICTNEKFVDLIKDYLLDGKRFKIKIIFSITKKPQGTIKEIKNCKSKIDETFLLYYGDALTNLNITEMKKNHIKQNADVTLALTQPRSEYGIVHTSLQEITQFEEKPILEHKIWIGIAILKRELLEYSKGKDFAKNLFPVIINKKKIIGYTTNSYWMDIGSVGALDKANKKFKT